MCKMSTKAVLVHRGRIMRQAAMILHETDFQVCLGFLYGKENPADGPSRFAVPFGAPLVFQLGGEWLKLVKSSFLLVQWQR